MSASQNIPLVELSPELRRLVERDQRVPIYRQLYDAVVNGRIPAERDGRSWTVRRENLPLVLEAFGLTAAANAAV